MNRAKKFYKTGMAGFVLAAMFLVTLTGCVGYVRAPRAAAYAAPPGMEPSVVVEDDYIYYPGYHVYYSSNRRQYLCLEHGAWISRPAPRGVSINILLASPSVRMDFHDSPAHHHAAIVREYPGNWAPSRSHQVEKDNRRDDQRGGHEENNRR